MAGTAVVSLVSPFDANSTEKGVRMDQAFPGWRARIGVIYPASGLADMEYYRLCPSGVSVHLTRSSVPNDGGVTLADVLEVAEGRQFTQLAEDLATVRPHALAWMCTLVASAEAPLGTLSSVGCLRRMASARRRRPRPRW